MKNTYLILVAVGINISAMAVNPRREFRTKKMVPTQRKQQAEKNRQAETTESDSIYCPELNCWSETNYFAGECVQHGPTAAFLNHLARKNMPKKAADEKKRTLPALLQAHNHAHNTSRLYTIAGFVQSARVSKEAVLEQGILYLSCKDDRCMNIAPFKGGPVIHIPLEPVEASFFQRALSFFERDRYALYRTKGAEIEVGLFYSRQECVDRSSIVCKDMKTMTLKVDNAAMLARALEQSIYCSELNCWSLKAACLLHKTIDEKADYPRPD